ncbi:MAG: 3-hydroxyisobutyrate dehydrogenase [Hyphomicrobiales bacterium]|nr:3-hydroxyisobutyrate dehydrogenase [Hyphomicrobiales bacterium]
MARIGFVGLGNMGGPMAANLLKAGHELNAYDIVPAALQAAEAAGAKAVGSGAQAASAAEVVITMLPAGQHVRDAYLGPDGIIVAAEEGALLVDCSTIDVGTARAVGEAAAEAGKDMIDAPVSGGVGGAEAATLTFMVGGSDAAFERAKPVLDAMGKNIFHAGGSGNGQAAKICNNMILAISMVAVCEGFTLAEKLGLDHQKLFDIASTASGQCWSMTNYCPVPGPVPSSPANRDFQPGFTAAMMLKDLRLSQDAAREFDATTPLGAEAAALFGLFVGHGNADVDFSAIVNFLRGTR